MISRLCFVYRLSVMLVDLWIPCFLFVLVCCLLVSAFILHIFVENIFTVEYNLQHSTGESG